MTFTINENTIYVEPISTVSDIYGRDIRLNKANRDMNVDNSFFPVFGHDKKLPNVQLPQAQGVPKLYKNQNDRLIPSMSNFCAARLDSPTKIWDHMESSNFVNTRFPNVDVDPKYSSQFFLNRQMYNKRQR